MALIETLKVSCDHITKDGTACVACHNVDVISPTDPFYHIKAVVEVVDKNGSTQLTAIDMFTCRWDLYYALSNIHDIAQADLKARQEKAAAENEKREAV